MSETSHTFRCHSEACGNAAVPFTSPDSDNPRPRTPEPEPTPTSTKVRDALTPILLRTLATLNAPESEGLAALWAARRPEGLKLGKGEEHSDRLGHGRVDGRHQRYGLPCV